MPDANAFGGALRQRLPEASHRDEGVRFAAKVSLLSVHLRHAHDHVDTVHQGSRQGHWLHGFVKYAAGAEGALMVLLQRCI